MAKPRPAPVRAFDDRSVAIAYLHPGQVSAYFAESLIATLGADFARALYLGQPRRIANVLQEWSSANISDARNTLVRRFLDDIDPKPPWLLFIDSDMKWAPQDVDALLDVADPDTLPIVGGLCFGNGREGLQPTIYQWVKIAPDTVTTMRVSDYPPDALVPCAATGAAFILIHRRVLEALRERAFNPTFPWFQETELGGRPAGEDITFCIRAALLDFPTHVHTGVRIGHHKSTVLDEDLFRAEQARKAGQ